ncbi:unnamed protein product [Meganyctiphanes norvegica]|uniref:Uncharacterized protein n=1 Tax=Meganyctiphanes norvegica TaxID=48144 RepID=A0AAV2QKD2_MEGNR
MSSYKTELSRNEFTSRLETIDSSVVESKEVVEVCPVSRANDNIDSDIVDIDAKFIPPSKSFISQPNGKLVAEKKGFWDDVIAKRELVDMPGNRTSETNSENGFRFIQTDELCDEMRTNVTKIETDLGRKLSIQIKQGTVEENKLVYDTQINAEDEFTKWKEAKQKEKFKPRVKKRHKRASNSNHNSPPNNNKNFKNINDSQISSQSSPKPDISFVQQGKPKATALTKGRKGRPPSPKPQDIFSTDDEDDEVLGRYGNTILEVRKGMVLENRRNWEKKQRNKEAHLSQNSVQRPKTLPFISKKNVALQYSSGHIMASPSISIPSTPSSEVIRMLTPPPDCPFTPEENKSFLQSIKGKVAEQRKRYDSIGSLGSSCDNLDESENCSQDEADVFTGSYTAGKVKERKKMWENKIKELQKKNEKPTSHGRLSNKKNKRSSKSELHKSFTSDEELDTLRKISRRVSRSGSLKYLLHNTTDGNIYIETTDDELIKNYVGDDTPPSSLEYSLDDHLDNVSHEFSSYFNEENGPKAPTRKKKKEQNSRMEVVTSSPQYPPGASKDLAIMLTTSSFNQKQLNPAGGLRCYLVHSAHGSNKTRSMSLPDLTAIVPSNYEDTFETGENYTEYKNKFASTRRFFESVSHDFASEESDINRECGDICNRCGPFKPKKTGDYYSDDGFERYLYVEKKHFLDIDCSTERSSSRNSIDQAIQTDKHYRSRDKGCQSSADSSPTHCPSCHHDLNLNSRPRKRKSMKTYDLIQLPKMKRKILKKRQGQHHNDISQSLPSSDIDVFESNTLRNNLGKQKPWDINPIDGNPWISSLNKQHSLPYEGMGMEPQTNKYSDEETKQHSLPYGGVGIREQSNNYSDDETNQHSLPYGGVGIREQSNNYSNDDDEESWSMRVKSYGMFGLRNPLPLVASLKDLSRNLPSPYPDAPQDILDDLDHSVFQNVPRGQVIHTLGGLYNKEYPHIPIRQHQRGTQHRYNKHHENLITHKDLRRSSLHSMPESWAKNKSVYSVGLFSDVNGDDNHNLENESIVPSRTLYSPVPLPRTKSLGLDDVQNKSSEVCDNNEYTINTNYYYNSNQQNNEEISKSEAEFIARNVGELKQRLDDEINCPISEYLNSVQDHEPHKHGMEHHMDYNEPSCPSSSDEDEQDQSLYNDQSMEDLTNEDFQKQSMRSSQDLKSCRAYGLGLEWGKVDRVNTFTIDTNGATSGEVTVSVEGPHEGSVSRTEVYPVDEDAGLYQVHYTVTTPSTYQLAITWAHQHIQGSPFACYVEE